MRYLISGYYGEKNAGDEAILAAILQEISQRDVDARFTVLSFDPADTNARHAAAQQLEVISTSLRPPTALRSALKESDLLISGGGSLLHEADFELHGRSFLFRQGKLRPIPYFLSIVFMARSQKLPVMWYAQGLGPLHTAASRRLVARAASLSQAVTWRDPASARLAYEIGARPPVQQVVPDPAYALTPAPAPEVQAELLRHALPAGLRYVAVCVRPWLGRAGYLEALGQALERVAADRDLAVLFVPLHESHDPAVCETLAAGGGGGGGAPPRRGRPPGGAGFAGRAHSLQAVGSPSLLAGILGNAELVVAMRLHAGILAARAGTPAVVLDYDPKTRAFAEQTGQSRWAVPVDELETVSPGSVDKLVAAVTESLSGLPARRAALARAVLPLRAEAGRTAGLAVQLAHSGGVLALSESQQVHRNQ